MEYFDLGTLTRPVSTGSAEAQLWFDRGLAWTYAFNHEEAVRCFEEAATADPDCAMAHWGIAYALGPNYNKPWESFDPLDLERTVSGTHAAVERARACAAGATPVERALIEALLARYPQSQAPADCSVWNPPYAEAMRGVHELAPDDPDIATLYADALMNLTPGGSGTCVRASPPKGPVRRRRRRSWTGRCRARRGPTTPAPCTCTSI